MNEEFMLTTSDNPYNPFTQFDEWWSFDTEKGYNTCAYLDRVAYVTSELGDVVEDEAINLAMDEILKLNITGNYMKVTKDYVFSEE